MNEIIFVERQSGVVTKDSIAGKFFMNLKQFPIDEIQVVSEPPPLSRKETPTNLKPNDPRGKSSVKSNVADHSTFEQTSTSMIARRQSLDEIMNEVKGRNSEG